MQDTRRQIVQCQPALSFASHRRGWERTLPRLCVILLAVGLSAVLVTPVRAQETNISLYQKLALQCLSSLPDSIESFELDASREMPYLRPALVAGWQEEGRNVYLADSLAQNRDLPILRYRVDDASVAYEPEGRGRLRRTVALTLQYTLVAADGRLATEQRCTESTNDLISRRDIDEIEAGAYPETQSAIPDAGWIRRYLEPAVLTVATAVGVYLFFSIRSGERENPQ